MGSSMISTKKRSYSRYTKEAVILLGKYIQQARKARKFTEVDFAERVGISRTTLRKIEKGEPQCELGIALEAAAIAGVKLFDVDQDNAFHESIQIINDKIAFLPKRIRKQVREVDDAF